MCSHHSFSQSNGDICNICKCFWLISAKCVSHNFWRTCMTAFTRIKFAFVCLLPGIVGIFSQWWFFRYIQSPPPSSQNASLSLDPGRHVRWRVSAKCFHVAIHVYGHVRGTTSCEHQKLLAVFKRFFLAVFHQQFFLLRVNLIRLCTNLWVMEM